MRNISKIEIGTAQKKSNARDVVKKSSRLKRANGVSFNSHYSEIDTQGQNYC